jgi:hypothetical protein
MVIALTNSARLGAGALIEQASVALNSYHVARIGLLQFQANAVIPATQSVEIHS